MLANYLETLSVDVTARKFFSASCKVLKYGAIDALVCIGRRNVYLRSQLPREVLDCFRSCANDALLLDAEILAANLRAQKMESDVPDDFIEEPASAIGTLEVISDCSVVIWVGCLFRTH